MVFMSTANRDQKSSLCSTSRSLNQANAWRKKSYFGQILGSLDLALN